MSAVPATQRMRVGIVGGGLAGATLANALLKLPNIDVDIFEAKSNFSERGAAVGLVNVAQLALGSCVGDGKALLQKAGAVEIKSVRNKMGHGPHAGKTLYDTPGAGRAVVVHRASLLRELIAPLPAKMLHASKSLASVSQTEEGTVQLAFEDGTVEKFDAVIGADGIFSTVRNHVLRDDAEKYAASPAGFWDCRNVVPIEEARAELGEELFKDDRQYGWCGNGGFIMHDVMENGSQVQCVIAGLDKSTSVQRSRDLSEEGLKEVLGDWLDGPIAAGMIKLMMKQPNPQGYAEWEHKQTPTYFYKNVCIMGDAAHASTPWQGSGTAMAFEDAMVMGALFEAASSGKDIPLVFRAFEETRMTRCQQIIDSSRGTGTIFCGQDKDIGLDPDMLTARLPPRWDFIMNLDPEAHKKEALAILENLRNGSSQ